MGKLRQSTVWHNKYTLKLKVVCLEDIMRKFQRKTKLLKF